MREVLFFPGPLSERERGPCGLGGRSSQLVLAGLGTQAGEHTLAQASALSPRGEGLSGLEGPRSHPKGQSPP